MMYETSTSVKNLIKSQSKAIVSTTAIGMNNINIFLDVADIF
jgi:hypothetical protein